MHLLIFVILFSSSLCVEITRFVVPSITKIGSIMELDCAYDLKGDQLYSVNWYKDDREFFRCKNNGEVQTFDVPNIQILLIERATFGSCHVSLTTFGTEEFVSDFSCEVSTEGPQFKTTSRTEHVKVKQHLNNSMETMEATTRNEESKTPVVTSQMKFKQKIDDQVNKSSCINAYLHFLLLPFLLYAFS